MTSYDVAVPQGHSNSLFALRRAWLTIDQNQQAIDFVSGWRGKILLHLVFIAILALTFSLSTASLALIGVTLFAVALFPARRVPVMVAASIFYLAMRPFRVEGWSILVNMKAELLPYGLPTLVLQGVGVGAFLAFAAAFLAWQQAKNNHAAARHPVRTLLMLWFMVLGGALATSPDSALGAFLWTLSGVWISSFWFLAYAAVDQRGRDSTPLTARVGWMRPFWGGSATPIGKSFGYLNKFDAKNEFELAQTRLKALKLGAWALVLLGIYELCSWIFHQYLQVPPLQSAIMAHSQSTGFSTGMNWSSLISNYFFDLLVIAIWGHLIVATIRMVGYRIPRNTRNPLASRTLAEFWNRYFFYFKELLVDFFFYPAFLRYFKKNTKLRIAFATFCAAAVGNFLYHFTRETYIFATLPIADALPVFQSAMFYSLALAAGLIVSQWRGAKPKPEHGFIRYEVLPRLNVFAFFCFLKIFDDISGDGTFSDRIDFTLGLFSL